PPPRNEPEPEPMAADAGGERAPDAGAGMPEEELPPMGPPLPPPEEELPPMGPPLPPDYGYEQDPEEEEELAPIGGEPLTPEEQADNPNAAYSDFFGYEVGGEIPIDPTLPTFPQIMAEAPATNHPEGDVVAGHEWLNGKVKGDVVFFYEPPLEVARRKLMGNPELIRTLGAKAPEEDPQARRLREFAEAMR